VEPAGQGGLQEKTVTSKAKVLHRWMRSDCARCRGELRNNRAAQARESVDPALWDILQGALAIAAVQLMMGREHSRRMSSTTPLRPPSTPKRLDLFNGIPARAQGSDGHDAWGDQLCAAAVLLQQLGIEYEEAVDRLADAVHERHHTIAQDALLDIVAGAYQVSGKTGTGRSGARSPVRPLGRTLPVGQSHEQAPGHSR
jgi:hypothetical protein